MKSFFAAWREFQDTVVGHPFCRYTILPAGIILGILLTALFLAAGIWCREGWNAYSFADGPAGWNAAWSWFLLLASVGVMGLMLTGRWLPTLIGLLPAIFARATYEQSVFHGTSCIFAKDGMYDIPFMWKRLAVFAPVFLWLLYLDRKPSRWPVLPRRMKWLAVGSAVFCASLIAALLPMENYWIQAGLLQALSAAFWFTVFVDLVRRMSREWRIRLILFFLAVPVLMFFWGGLVVSLFVILIMAALAFLLGQLWVCLRPHRTTGGENL